MDLRSTVCTLAEKYFDCGKELTGQIALLEGQNKDLVKEISGLESTLKNELAERKQDFERISELEEKLKLCEQAYSNPTKIPIKSIKYIRNVWLGESLGWKPASIDVKLFITTNDNSIAQELRARKLVLNDLKDLDTLVPKIYSQTKSDYKYGYDNDYGFSEHWLYPYELVHARKNGAKGDCDDWAIKIVSWLRCAGVPADRVFVSCGTIKQGTFGHATVYVRRYSDDEWVHLNSTSPHTKKTSLQDFPLKDDESDWIGIHPDKFWFSFNDRIAISKFETEEAREFFEKEKAMQNVVIE